LNSARRLVPVSIVDRLRRDLDAADEKIERVNVSLAGALSNGGTEAKTLGSDGR
jgi:hypothetical protein